MLSVPSKFGWGWGARPEVVIDGQPAPADWGRTDLPVFPGPHRVAIRTAGWASHSGWSIIDVNVAPTQSIPIHYKPPSSPGPGKPDRVGKIGFYPIS